MTRAAHAATLLTCLALAAGCGERQVTVRGRLLQGGRPLDLRLCPKRAANGPSSPPAVTFIPATDRPGRKDDRFRARVDLDQGTYEVRLPAGKYRVSVFVPGTAGRPPRPEADPVYDLTGSRELDLEVGGK